ncbi:hypothetical protein ABPG74_000968 [Tetrahymena malaccensis]
MKMKRVFIFISLLSILSIASLYLIQQSSSDNQDLDLSNPPRCFSFDGDLIPDPPTFEHPEVEVGFFAQNRCREKMRFKFISSTKQEETICLEQYQDDLIHMFGGDVLKHVEEKC